MFSANKRNVNKRNDGQQSQKPQHAVTAGQTFVQNVNTDNQRRRGNDNIGNLFGKYGAQAARDEADRQEEAWRARENANRASAQAVLAKAKADAAAKTEQRLAKAQTKIDAKLADAETRIAASRDAAMGEIEAVAADAAQDIVQRLAGVKIAKPSAAKAVKEVMAHG